LTAATPAIRHQQPQIVARRTTPDCNASSIGLATQKGRDIEAVDAFFLECRHLG
jgi:hypothetical protein